MNICESWSAGREACVNCPRLDRPPDGAGRRLEESTAASGRRGGDSPMFGSSRARRRRAPRTLAVAGLAALAVGGATIAAPSATVGSTSVAPYQDPSLPIPQRVDDLMSRMTLAEKIGQMT